MTLVFIGALVAPALASAVGSISGSVTAASGGAPLQGVEVCAGEFPEEEDFGCVLTGASGTYVIPGLSSGDYKVEFWPGSSMNFVPQYFASKSSWESADLLAVADGVDTPNINAALATGGWVAGRVADAVSKAGIGGIYACAWPIDEEGIGRCAQTAPSGDYQINGLATDSYEVVFFPENEEDYFPQHYNGKDFFFEATPVAVTAGFGVTGIDAQLRSKKAPPTVPATPSIPPVPPVAKIVNGVTKPGPARCKKGFKRKKVKGKARCVRVHKLKKRHGGRRHAHR